MDVNKERKEMVDLLENACRLSIQYINDNYEKIYAFILYTSEGFSNLSLVIKLDEIDLLDEYYYGICADEWSDLDETDCDVFFKSFNKKLQELDDEYYNYIDEYGKEPYDIHLFFEGICIEVFKKLESEQLFEGKAFAGDVLKGLQFSSIGDTDVVKNISKAVNSPEWHDKVTIYCDNV